MVITKEILDELSAKARASERLRCNLDLRNSSEDQSQRMLNALEPGTVMPIDFVEFFHDSANFKQVWFALVALEVQLPHENRSNCHIKYRKKAK